MFKRSFLVAMPVALGRACAAEAAVITVDALAPLRMRCNLASALAAAERNQPVEGWAAGETGVADQMRFSLTLVATATLGGSTLISQRSRIVRNGRDRISIEVGLGVQTGTSGMFVL